METRAATLVIEEVPIDSRTPVRAGVELQSIGPLAVKMTDGWLACGPVVVNCRDVEGVFSVCPVTIDGRQFITAQLDVAHPHQSLRVASSFALEVDDFARMLDRLRVVVDLARLEAGAAEERPS